MVSFERKPISNKEAAELELNSSDGLILRGVEKGSPAEASGLKKNDIIVEFNHNPIDNFVIFRRKLLALAPGQTIHLKIFRERKTFEVTSILIKKPTETEKDEAIFNEDDPSS